jgi:hypothetical protein
MDDRIALGAAAALLKVTPRTVISMAARGELTRTRGPLGWEYSRAEVLELARERERLYGPPVPGRGRGRPRRVRRPEQVSA